MLVKSILTTFSYLSIAVIIISPDDRHLLNGFVRKLMKKLLPYLLIYLYSTIMLKPVMPYITDAVAHILNFKGHMATVHAHNGKYHVHMEVAEAAKNDNGEKSTNTLKKYGSENEHIGIDKDCVRHSQYEARKYFTALPMTAISIYLNNDFPPPRG